MKAIQINRFGGPEVLEVAEIPTPVPGPGQVLVRVRAAGVNFAETLMRENRYAMTPPLPSVLGTEAAGVIEAVGPGHSRFAIGARVAAPLFAADTHFGGYAEYVVIGEQFVVPLPDAVSFEAASALMVQGLTALYLTRQAAPEGKTVLVNAAAGGVGTMLVQLAKRAGAAKVIAAASSADKLALARSLGADFGVDYTKDGWLDELREMTGGSGPDIIYESVGGKVTSECLAALAPRGQLVVYGALNIQAFQIGVPELLGLIFKNQSLTGFALAPLLTPESLQLGLATLFNLVMRGELNATIGASYPLARAADAHRALQERRTTGKIVLLP